MEIIKLEILNLASLDKSDGEVINFKEGALGNSNIFCGISHSSCNRCYILEGLAHHRDVGICITSRRCKNISKVSCVLCLIPESC